MAYDKNILVAVDPTKTKQPALELCANVMSLKLEGYNPKLTLLVGIDADKHDMSASNTELYKEKGDFEKLIAPLVDAGLEVSVKLSWSKDWADSLIFNAQAVEADSIMVSHPGSDTSRDFGEQFWYLLRNTPIPVGLIVSANAPERKNVLVAMDVRDEELTELNTRMFIAGRELAKMYGSDVHLAHAYQNSMEYPDRGRIVRVTGVPNENIHLEQGSPDEALRIIARKLQPDAIVVGATRRTGIMAALRGRKLAEIFQTLPFNMYVVV